MGKYKNAEYYGYKVGDKFKYKSDVNVNDTSGTFSSGDTLILDLDDHSTIPRFRNQYGQSAYECLELLEKIEDKPQSYADFVGKALTVKQGGYGFSGDYIGSSWVIDGYQDDGYFDSAGFKVKGHDNDGIGFVGVESFFPDGLVDGLSADTLIEPSDSEEGQREVTETETKCPSTAIQEILLACFDDKISVEISMDSVKVKWRGLTFVVDIEVGLEKVLNAIDILSEQQVEV